MRNISGPQTLVYIISLVVNGCLIWQSRCPVRSHYSSRCAIHALTLPSGARQICQGFIVPAARRGRHRLQLCQMASCLTRVGGHMVGWGRRIKTDFPPCRRIALQSRPQWYIPLRLQQSVLLLKPFMRHLCEHVPGVCSSHLT